MSKVAQIAEITGATRADVARVARRGGTTAADWDIAHAIEAAGGRAAAETMWSGHTRRPAPQAPASTNSAAEHDSQVRIYPENTSPEDTGRIAPHHPGDNTPETDQDGDEEGVEEFAAAAHSDIATLTGTDIAAWITGQVATQPTLAAARALLTDLMDTPQRLQHRLALAA